MRAPRRRGFTMYEVLIALALVMIILAIVVPKLNGGQRRGDEQARFSASAVADSQVAYLQEHGQWAARLRLAGRVRRITLVEPQTASTGATEASVGTSSASATDPGQVGIAVQGDTRCWLVRLTTAGTVWATQPATGSPCTGARALSFDTSDADGSRGSSPDRPVRLDP